MASPLGMTVHSLPHLDEEGLRRRTRSGRIKMLLVLALCAAPVLASYTAYFFWRPDSRSNYATLITPTRSMPADLALQGLDGQSVRPADLRRQWLLMVVSGADCAAPCEQHLLFQRQLRQMVGRERDRVDKLWLITDAAPIKPELLAALGGAEPTRALRVPREQLAKWLSPAPGQQLEDHLYLVDPMGEWMMRTPLNADPSKFKRDLERLLRASSSWDKAGR